MLKQLIYASQATRPMSDDDLLKILRVSWERNQAHRITGMLVYRDGIFLQALEGEDRELEPIWASIKADSRHWNIVEMRYVPVSKRDFPDWSMAFVNMSGTDFDLTPGYCAFLEEDFSPDRLRAKPGLARDFLLDMKYYNQSCEGPVSNIP